MNWISVKDKLPAPGSEVLVLMEVYYYIEQTKPLWKQEVVYYCCMREWLKKEEKRQADVRYWMPLPALPDLTPIYRDPYTNTIFVKTKEKLNELD